MLFLGDQMHPGVVKKADEMKTGVLVYKNITKITSSGEKII